ncbi:hypothetical protein A6E15_10165 [Natrinema saccharevitans]|uniref:Uncharacterized protein n=1 Tax=Natrinema saccharevitans TaxID=301967 RepID=A0A1S8AXP5_9EURY|nr:hypothetical protein [Natrinema saccharevitans]OLZ41329.1 hypothetical protein A6E15_10165 [Natrinema saccharevitans]
MGLEQVTVPDEIGQQVGIEDASGHDRELDARQRKRLNRETADHDVAQRPREDANVAGVEDFGLVRDRRAWMRFSRGDQSPAATRG